MQIRLDGRLILASASPRRTDMLRLLGLDFDVEPSLVGEDLRQGETPREQVLRLAEAKALAVANHHPDAWVLGADTVVAIAGELLGKPGSVAEAREMLDKLSGQEHEVFTGFSIVRLQAGIRLREAVASTVLFRGITREERDWYAAQDEPYDKAGAYAVQGMGAFFIREIRGSYTNVVGLPLCEVIDALKRVRAIHFHGDNHDPHR